LSAALGSAARGREGGILRQLEVDPRLVGMLAALAAIWVGFDLLSGGAFLTPRNLWNLSVQTASIAVMACGMVLVIVTRNIDLSVGAVLGFVGMVVGVLQARWLPELLGLENVLTAPIAVVAGVALGGAIGFLHGVLIAWLGIPSFIVTLGGLLVWRGAAWWVTQGQTVAPMDGRFRALGGGIEGAVGATASWIIAGLACAAIVVGMVMARRRRLRFRLHRPPRLAEAVVAVLAGRRGAGRGMAAILPAAAGIARRMTEAGGRHRGVPVYRVPHGLAVPCCWRSSSASRSPCWRPARASAARSSPSAATPEAAELSGHQHAADHHDGLRADGRAVRAGGLHLDRAAERRDESRRDRSMSSKSSPAAVIGGTSLARRRLDRRRHARRAGDAVAAVGDGAARRRHAAAEHRGRTGAGLRRLARRRLEEADQMSPPLVEMRDISIAFGGIKASMAVRWTCIRARWWGCSATTARASPR
jgi:D-xylose transport system permease protein